MRQVPMFILGFAIIASPVHSASEGPPSEAEIESRIKAIRQQQVDLRLQEEELNKELAQAKTRPFGGIKAEMHGIMSKDASGYFILCRMEHGQELKVWMRVSDLKTRNQYQALVGTEITAQGRLCQKPDQPVSAPSIPNAPRLPGLASDIANVPVRGMYFDEADVRGTGKIVPPVIPTVAPPAPSSPPLPSKSK